MSHGKYNPSPELVARRERMAAWDSSIPTNPKVREIEVFLLRYGAQRDSPLSEVTQANVMSGGGILVARGLQGEVFKIEITQVDGPQ